MKQPFYEYELTVQFRFWGGRYARDGHLLTANMYVYVGTNLDWEFTDNGALIEIGPAEYKIPTSWHRRLGDHRKCSPLEKKATMDRRERAQLNGQRWAGGQIGLRLKGEDDDDAGK